MRANRELPKSLHTHSVLVNVARHLHHAASNPLPGVWSGGRTPKQAASNAIKQALTILQLDTLPDTQGLIPRALSVLTAELAKAKQ